MSKPDFEAELDCLWMANTRTEFERRARKALRAQYVAGLRRGAGWCLHGAAQAHREADEIEADGRSGSANDAYFRQDPPDQGPLKGDR